MVAMIAGLANIQLLKNIFPKSPSLTFIPQLSHAALKIMLIENWNSSFVTSNCCEDFFHVRCVDFLPMPNVKRKPKRKKVLWLSFVEAQI